MYFGSPDCLILVFPTGCQLPTTTVKQTIHTILVHQSRLQQPPAMDINSDSGGVGSSGGRVNTLVPGHRKIYKEAGITKQQIKAGRTRYNQQTPVQEHQARAGGTIIESRRPPAEINFDKQCMKNLMD